jgi:hypothetical protein
MNTLIHEFRKSLPTKSLRACFTSVIILFFILLSWDISFAQDRLQERFDGARLAWDTGDYVRALEEFEALLKSPDGMRFFEPIALLTGELYQVMEITRDGRSIRISPDGRYAAYDAGTRAAPLTKIIAMDNPVKTAVEIKGTSLAFSPIKNMAAFLRVPETPEIASLRKEMEKITAQASPDRQALMSSQRQLAWLEAKAAQIILFDIAAKKEHPFKVEGLLKSGPVFSADGREVYFVGAKEADTTSNEIYAVSQSSSPRPLTSGPGFKINPIIVPGGKFLIYAAASQTPFPKPAPPEPPAKPGQAAAQVPSEAQFRPAAGPRQFAILSLEDGKSTTINAGFSPAVSADGSALAFLTQTGSETTLNLIKLNESLTPTVLKKTQERIGSVSPAPDGSGIVFDMTYTRNGEIFFIKSDGKSEARLSREIEPDRAPRFLNQNQVLAIKGEPRHSRAHIYDLNTLSNFRVFHNNSLRTIAPEYEWVSDATGTRLFIGAERDGDTISPERGVYLVDLTKKITTEELLARIRNNLEGEKSLRVKGEKTFQPVRDLVKAAVDEVSITKIFEYEEALFNFDSKYITMPGNKLAGEYIFNTFKSFGYQPEFQEFESRGIKTANVLARLPGTENPDILYILSSHCDSTQRGPGADDNSSATAALLETARVLAKIPMPSTIIFAAFTGEEAGLLGSREFVRQAKEKKWQIAADLNNDMIGWTNDHRLDNTIRYSNAGIRDIQHAGAFLFSKMVTYDTRYVKSTDAVAFFDAFGDIVGGLGSYPVLGNPYYHQATDLLETVNHQLLVEASKFNIASIIMLTSSPTTVKDLRIINLKSNSAEVTWAPAPEKGIASYVLEFGPEKDPSAFSLTVTEPRAMLQGFQLRRGEKLAVAVKAVNGRGISSWDWTRTTAAVTK